MVKAIAVNERRALRFGLATVALWSTVATAFKLSLSAISPLGLVSIAAAVSWSLFLVLALQPERLAKLKRLSGRAIALAGVTGLLNPALYYYLLFAAYDRLPAQEAMAINYTWALTLPLLAAPILGHTLQRRELLAALLSYAGVYLIATRGQPMNVALGNPSGVAFALASTVTWALYWIANTRHRIDPVLALFLNFSAAVPVLLLLSIWQGAFVGLALPAVAGGVYIGLVEMGLSFVLWLTAMRLTSNTLRLSTLIFLSPPISLVLIATLLGEPIQGYTVLGLAIILAGLTVQHRGREASN